MPSKHPFRRVSFSGRGCVGRMSDFFLWIITQIKRHGEL